MTRAEEELRQLQLELVAAPAHERGPAAKRTAEQNDVVAAERAAAQTQRRAS